jgi:hypothetical protein
MVREVRESLNWRKNMQKEEKQRAALALAVMVVGAPASALVGYGTLALIGRMSRKKKIKDPVLRYREAIVTYNNAVAEYNKASVEFNEAIKEALVDAPQLRLLMNAVRQPEYDEMFDHIMRKNFLEE